MKFLTKLLACLLCVALTGASQSTHVPDRTTLIGKLVMGYQGWFVCPAENDGRWVHWFHGQDVTVDMLPDMSEAGAEERCTTPWTGQDGKPVTVYSVQNIATVDRHFAWMEQYGIETVALQRFASELHDPHRNMQIDRVLQNVRTSAEKHGRTFFVEYDISGVESSAGIDAVIADWSALQASTVHSARYQQHAGRPVVGVFGIGFKGKYASPSLATKLLDRLHAAGATVMAGVPSGWRTLTRDADGDEDWREVYRKADILSPWTVGRFNSIEGADEFRREVIEPDIADAKLHHQEFMPVVFPGFSWHNLMARRGTTAATNQIPRACGSFYWRQVRNAVTAGSTMLFNAMFDEVDEGTAMFKTVARTEQLPASPPFLALDADGCDVPSDWYLQLAGIATRTLQGKSFPTPDVPLPMPERPLTFLHLADPQMGMFTGNHGSEQEALNLTAVAAAAQALKPAFAVICGDLINNSRDVEELAAFKSAVSGFGKVSVHLVAGNHDVGDKPTAARLAWYRTTFGPDYYTFRSGPLFGIVLDSMLMDPGNAPEESAKQFAWLGDVLKHADGKQIAVFQHIPFFTHTADEEDSYWNVPRAAREQYLALLKQYGVRHVYAGHLHYALHADDDGMQIDVAGPVGKPLGKGVSGGAVVRVRADGTQWEQYFPLDQLSAAR